MISRALSFVLLAALVGCVSPSANRDPASSDTLGSRDDRGAASGVSVDGTEFPVFQGGNVAHVQGKTVLLKCPKNYVITAMGWLPQKCDGQAGYGLYNEAKLCIIAIATCDTDGFVRYTHSNMYGWIPQGPCSTGDGLVQSSSTCVSGDNAPETSCPTGYVYKLGHGCLADLPDAVCGEKGLSYDVVSGCGPNGK
jgi:hypothetical protein